MQTKEVKDLAEPEFPHDNGGYGGGQNGGRFTYWNDYGCLGRGGAFTARLVMVWVDLD